MENIDLNQFPDIPNFALEDLQKKIKGAVQLEDGVQRMVVNDHDGGIAYRFFIHSEYNPTKSAAAGYEVFDEIEMVQWFVDRRTKPVERVRFLPEGLLSFNRFGEPVSGRYLEAYIRFKEGKQAIGTPLERWGILSQGEVASLSAESIYTVEQLAAQREDRIIGRFPDSFVEAYERAKQYVNGLDMQKANEEQVARLGELESQNLRLQKQLDELLQKQSEVDIIRRSLHESGVNTEQVEVPEPEFVGGEASESDDGELKGV